MASYSDKLKVFENIIAKVGIENAMVEYAKRMAQLNGFDSYMENNPPMLQNIPNMPQGGVNNPQPVQEAQPANPMAPPVAQNTI